MRLSPEGDWDALASLIRSWHIVHLYMKSMVRTGLRMWSVVQQVLRRSKRLMKTTSVAINYVKGIVHPKIKLQSLSTHHCADGGVGQVFESTKHLRRFRGEKLATQRQIQYKWSKWKVKESLKCLHTACVVSSKCPQTPTFIFFLTQHYLHHVLSLSVLCCPPLETLLCIDQSGHLG